MVALGGVEGREYGWERMETEVLKRVWLWDWGVSLTKLSPRAKLPPLLLDEGEGELGSESGPPGGPCHAVPQLSFEERLRVGARLDEMLDSGISAGSPREMGMIWSREFELLKDVVIAIWVDEEEADDENVLERSNRSVSRYFDFRVLFRFLGEIVVGEWRSVV